MLSPAAWRGAPALAVAALAAAAQAQPDPARFVFRFAPPDATAVVQTSRFVRERNMVGQAPVRDETVATLRGVFRKVGAGYEYSPRIVSNQMRRNGQPLTDPMAGLLMKIEPTYVIGAGGQAQEIRGYAHAEKMFQEALPPPLFAAVSPMFTEAAIVEREKAEWNSRYADFAGAEFAIGDAIDAKAPYRLPNGEPIEYTIRTSFPRWEDCPAGRCVRVEQIYESDARALAQMAQGLTEGVLAAAGVGGAASAPAAVAAPAATAVAAAPAAPAAPAGAAPGVPTARITGRMSRLIDPKTMLIYSESVRRTITMQVSVRAGVPMASILREERDYAYAYER
jgi:hypothetical protein